MKKVEYWEVLGKQYNSEKEAKDAAQDYIRSNAKYHLYDDVWIWDNLNDRIMNSYIENIRLDWYDNIEYVIAEFDNCVSENQIFSSLDDLLYHITANIYRVNN